MMIPNSYWVPWLGILLPSQQLQTSWGSTTLTYRNAECRMERGRGHWAASSLVKDLKCHLPDVTVAEVWDSRLPFGDVPCDLRITTITTEQVFCPLKRALTSRLLYSFCARKGFYFRKAEVESCWSYAH